MYKRYTNTTACTPPYCSAQLAVMAFGLPRKRKKPTAADWSNLLPGILEGIARRVHDHDHVVFASVCRSWRRASSAARRPSAQPPLPPPRVPRVPARAPTASSAAPTAGSSSWIRHAARPSSSSSPTAARSGTPPAARHVVRLPFRHDRRRRRDSLLGGRSRVPIPPPGPSQGRAVASRVDADPGHVRRVLPKGCPCPGQPAGQLHCWK